LSEANGSGWRWTHSHSLVAAVVGGFGFLLGSAVIAIVGTFWTYASVRVQETALSAFKAATENRMAIIETRHQEAVRRFEALQEQASGQNSRLTVVETRVPLVMPGSVELIEAIKHLSAIDGRADSVDRTNQDQQRQITGMRADLDVICRASRLPCAHR
jgi:hypothetical protein